MKMFQGFGKVDLPKLKWRSERRDGNARAMGGVLAAWAGGGQATEPALAGFWPLSAGRCWPCRNGENCFQRSAMKSIGLDQSREHFPWSSHFPCKPFLVLGAAGIVVSHWLICPFFVFVFWLSISFLGLTARKYVGELNHKQQQPTNCELYPQGGLAL